jgi:hypothetical protein
VGGGRWAVGWKPPGGTLLAGSLKRAGGFLFETTVNFVNKFNY